MSIIGAKHLIHSFRHERGGDVSKRPTPYTVRDKRLIEDGYEKYAEYLKSDLWKQIRAIVLKENPLCLLCDSSAEQVHHLKYHRFILLGLGNEWLASLCRSCHHGLEFDGKKKLRMGDVNLKFFAALRRTERGSVFLKKYYAAQKKSKKLLRQHETKGGYF